MRDEEKPTDPRRKAEETFTRFLSRGPADDDGLQTLFSEHPALAPVLRELAERWRSEKQARKEAPPEQRIERVRELLERLRGRPSASHDFEAQGEVARGGMGTIFRLFDPVLRRQLAKKVLKRERAEGASDRVVGRFLDEAQITAQLDHPGVVPIHDVGVDRSGQVYFTMRLVKGEDLRAIFKKVRSGEEGWSLARAVGVMLRVCETMAYAHGKEVVHRDLKPANIMVGRFGETYVMDWGLARVLGSEDAHDLRIRVPHDETTSSVRTHMREGGDSADSPVITVDGEVIGTPVYMSPEQANGATEQVGKASDVYAIGAILYELLAGHMPYLPPGKKASAHSILRWVQDGPPHALGVRAPQASPELIAICDKAMARHPNRRYASVEAMGEDLRAWLENRVVRAHRTGALVEFGKWVRRNQLAAIAFTALFAVVAGSGFIVALQLQENARSESIARAESDFRLDHHDSDALVREADTLWPVAPSQAGRMRRWIAAAETLLAKRPAYERAAAQLRPLGRPKPDARAESASEPGTIEASRNRIASLEIALGQIESVLAIPNLSSDDRADNELLRDQHRFEYEWRRRQVRRADLASGTPVDLEFDNELVTRRFGDVTRLLNLFAILDDPEVGCMRDVRERLARAESLPAETIDAAGEAWREAIAAVGDESRCPAYHGMRLEPRLGLIPLRIDPQSGLYEFWHPLSGARPDAGANGSWKLRCTTGLVFVLIPGGPCVLGAQRGDSEAANYDPDAAADAKPYSVELDAYYVSKYEMTLAQWMRLTDTLPNAWHPGHRGLASIEDSSLINPVESIAWEESSYLSRWGLCLPTEAQWEHAARGGREGPFWWSASGDDASAFANLTERGTQADGWNSPCPVDRFPANPYGLHNVIGNVTELCADWFAFEPWHETFRAGDGECRPSQLQFQRRVARGGNWGFDLPFSRVTTRMTVAERNRDEFTGVRPAVGLR